MHTPGPWTVNPKTLAVYAPDRHARGCSVAVADCDCSWLLANEIRANAALVAAAPNMLAEAQRLLTTLQGMAIHPSHYAGLAGAVRRATGGA